MGSCPDTDIDPIYHVRISSTVCKYGKKIAICHLIVEI